MALFESYDRRIDHINAVLKEYGINGIEEAKAICDAKGIDPYTMCKETQPICFENACWAYVVGAAIAIKKGCPMLPKLLKLSVSVCRHSVSPVLLPTIVGRYRPR